MSENNPPRTRFDDASDRQDEARKTGIAETSAYEKVRSIVPSYYGKATNEGLMITKTAIFSEWHPKRSENGSEGRDFEGDNIVITENGVNTNIYIPRAKNSVSVNGKWLSLPEDKEEVEKLHVLFSKVKELKNYSPIEKKSKEVETRVRETLRHGGGGH